MIKKKIEAKIVADSKNSQGNRITTFLLTFPRFILPELNTHRVFSKNSASSRAIPFEKMVKMVEEDPFIPIAWQKDHKGMQGTEYFTDERVSNYSIDLDGNEVIYQLKEEWLAAKNDAVEQAINMNQLGLTKQIVNRCLEPFMWHTVLLTATEFGNFFNLRCPIYKGKIQNWRSWKDVVSHAKKENPGLVKDLESYSIIKRFENSVSSAEIHMQALAESMWDAYQESIPKLLQPGEYHIPFGDNIEMSILDQQALSVKFPSLNSLNDLKIRIATARAARLSYMTFDGEINYEKDLQLYDSLLSSGHMSPFEHVSRCMSKLEYYSFIKGKYPTTTDSWGIVNYELYPFKMKEMFPGEDYEFVGENPKIPDIYGWCNNFRGFIQQRYYLENEKYVGNRF